MPGGPHHMRTKDGAVEKCLLNALIGGALHAQSQCPFCSRIILGLDSAQPLHHIAGLLKRSLGNELVVKSLVCNIQVYHDCSSCLYVLSVVVIKRCVSFDMSTMCSIPLKEDSISPRL